ncbi:MAG: hypothetical protein US70_C0008G0011 [Parcubacteria group bacterium GW2011_GWD2_38_11]|nr:MAG: hypothetical protein US70_C0008G0011 [Parcubacteria group bacterium GW2011_GWD2_38_11]
MSKKIVLVLLVVVCFLFPKISLARQNVTDWYIQDFDSKIIVNKDSSLDVTETITADCGAVVNKHGIFRILPTRLVIAGKKVSTPVELLSITNEKGQPYKYKTSENSSDGTVTWQIGDANVAVQGVNIYVIRYKVQNTIRFDNQKFDELYWNLNGNFWDLQTDKFHAAIIFPQEINSQNATVDYYTGSAGSKAKDAATFHWSAPNVLEFDSVKTLLERQGVTASIIFSKNIFTPYTAGFWQTYGQYFYFLIPLIVFLVCFRLWWKYGKDPKVDKAIIPEYEAPGSLSPIELGMLSTNGRMGNSLITAEIINLAVKGVITIEEVKNKILFFTTKDHKLTRTGNSAAEQLLNEAQKIILAAVFVQGNMITLSSLKNKFYTNLPKIKKASEGLLKEKKLISPSGVTYAYMLSAIGGGFVFIGLIPLTTGRFGISMITSGIVIFLFGLIMPKRTNAGAELNWEIKGFKLFMETVDKDRAVFYEKENIFEKFLPYAIVFDMTEIWIQRMKDIYGEQFYNTYAPAWYVGSMANFDSNSLNSAISDLSSGIAASTSSPSGAGGSGGSGGGGGGGGGGGW